MTTLMDRRALLAGMGALALPASAFAKPGQVNYPALEAFLDSYVPTGKLPGMVLAIRRGNDPVRYISRGTVAFGSDIPAGPETLYRIYSMTKPVTGFAAMKLVEDGKLKLDQPLSDILPDFKNMQVMANAEGTELRPATKPILIRHLLTHSAGFGYAISDNVMARLYIKNGIVPGGRQIEKAPGADLAPARDLEEFGRRLAKMPLSFEPGSRWQYSVSLDLLGLVIQRVSGMTFHQYLQKTFFTPLKMIDTDFMVPANKLNRFTSVITVRDGKPVVVDDRAASPFARDRDLPSGGGGLVSTAKDYSRFTGMLVNEGTFERVRVLKPETVRLGRSNLLEPGVKFGGRNGFGAGVSVILPEGVRPGTEPAGSFSWFGIAGTQMWMDPVNKLSVVLMLQMQPTTYPVQQEVRVAAYKDLAAIPA